MDPGGCGVIVSHTSTRRGGYGGTRAAVQRSIVIDLIPRDGTIKSEHRLGRKLAEGCRGRTKERADPRSVGRLGVSLFRTTDLSARTLSSPLATGERDGTRWSNVAGVAIGEILVSVHWRARIL